MVSLADRGGSECGDEKHVAIIGKMNSADNQHVSAQLTAHIKLRGDGPVMVSTIDEVDTIDERSLKPFET